MKIIADSGSTKTDWRTISDTGEVVSLKSVGLNPFYTSEDEIKHVVKATFENVQLKEVSQVFFYGAGCANFEKCDIVKFALNQVFTQAAIEVESDMLGTARALFTDKQGIAAILGTGSNSCMYDGEKIVRNVPSLGYILGDEGSGSYLGKHLLTAYLRGNLPTELEEDFKKKFSVTYAEMLDHIYRKPFPNRWLASFTVFLKDHIHDIFIKQLLRKCFQDFFENQLCRYDDYSIIPVGLSGSIAYHFSEIIRKTAIEKNLNISTIVEGPIDGLVEFHK